MSLHWTMFNAYVERFVSKHACTNPVCYFTYQLGQLLGQQLVNLFNVGLTINNFHLIGHSFGAHVAAYAGRYVMHLSNHNYTLPRITGLDPADSDWYDNGPYEPISKTDAIFVDIIHTDSGMNGAPHSTGTIDFWPNGGVRSQPGCPNDPYDLSGKLLNNVHIFFLFLKIVFIS